MSEELKLGEVISEGRQVHKDAIHIAVVPVYAGEDLRGGNKVKLAKYGKDTVVNVTWTEQDNDSGIGVVDPFVTDTIKTGQRFWLYLNPGSITSLRHDWTHPAFPEEDHHAVIDLMNMTDHRAASEQWIRDFIATSDCPDYDTLIKAAVGEYESDDGYNYISIGDDYFHCGGNDAYGEIPPELWHHIEVVTGKKVEKKPTYFSCSC